MFTIHGNILDSLHFLNTTGNTSDIIITSFLVSVYTNPPFSPFYTFSVFTKIISGIIPFNNAVFVYPAIFICHIVGTISSFNHFVFGKISVRINQIFCILGRRKQFIYTCSFFLIKTVGSKEKPFVSLAGFHTCPTIEYHFSRNLFAWLTLSECIQSFSSIIGSFYYTNIWFAIFQKIIKLTTNLVYHIRCNFFCSSILSVFMKSTCIPHVSSILLHLSHVGIKRSRCISCLCIRICHLGTGAVLKEVLSRGIVRKSLCARIYNSFSCKHTPIFVKIVCSFLKNLSPAVYCCNFNQCVPVILH